MMEKMKAENEKLAAAGGAAGGNSMLEEMLAAKQAELQVTFELLCLVAFSLYIALHAHSNTQVNTQDVDTCSIG